MITPVIADIVGSRQLPDRSSAQALLDTALAQVDADLPGAVRALRPIVGDELQGLYPSLPHAMATTLLLRLALPDGVECRFGVGIGAVGEVPSAAGGIAEGPGWWAARAAIDTVHALQSRAVPGARTWVAAAAQADADAAASAANAYLLARDQLVSDMTERTRRLVYGRCLGATQSDLAAGEGITQSAVSQALATSGAGAVVEGFRLLVAQ
ncbi:SatD family protein [Microbacterium fluvii]|uniref:SatD family protein n=1 Tax=Microbacterium fluvii TaxID=415215 RepID=A0ABW2HFI7_9MICO|nr:SatD family protein [Microbacterium fluvii]MCU4673541.1 SatD family protein [Microbacterium fluvii]